MRSTKRGCLYARTSIREKNPRSSIKVQLENGASVLGEYGITDYDTYVDEGASAFAERAGFDRMIRNLGRYKVVVADDLSRLFRDRIASAWLKDQMEHYPDTIVTTFRDKILVSDMPLCCLVLAGDLLEREATTLRSKRTDGRVKRAEEGKWAGGAPPFGYHISKKTGDIAILKREAIKVPRAFELAAKGIYPEEIARLLSKEGGHSRHGGDLTNKAVRDRLSNPLYFGLLVQEPEEGEYRAYRRDLKILSGNRYLELLNKPQLELQIMLEDFFSEQREQGWAEAHKWLLKPQAGTIHG